MLGCQHTITLALTQNEKGRVCTAGLSGPATDTCIFQSQDTGILYGLGFFLLQLYILAKEVEQYAGNMGPCFRTFSCHSY